MADDDKKKADDQSAGKDGDDKKPEGDKKADGDSGQAPPNKKADGDTKDSTDDLQARLIAAEKKASEAQKKIDALEEEKLKKAGDLEGLLKLEREKSTKLLGELKSVKVQAGKEKLFSQLGKEAPDAQNLDLLTRMPEVKKKVHIDNETLKITGVKETIQELRKSHPYLFKQKHTHIPGGYPNVDASKLNGKDNAMEFRNKLLGAKNSREKELIRQQYGREL